MRVRLLISAMILVAGSAGLRAQVPQPKQANAATISADLLRHPLPSKARDVIRKARRASDAGDHATAIRDLQQALAKYPDSAAWVQPLLGIEYLQTEQFAAAADALREAVELLPHDAVTRSNFGLSLACLGDYRRAEPELQRAMELNPANAKTRELHAIVVAAR